MENVLLVLDIPSLSSILKSSVEFQEESLVQFTKNIGQTLLLSKMLFFIFLVSKL